ncbi:MAG: sulfate ABC transporter ATP-binding protein [Terracidiphilus sp.]|nr:sulfate ABC transporter ATP-binding protein [Terracidiphilus sp.]
MNIQIEKIRKNFGTFTALENVTLTIPAGELVALLGPSGSGKTTLLRVIAGLETPDDGTVLLDGKDVTQFHVAERGIGFVFQHYALFRHMTIFENVAFGLRVQPRWQRLPRREIRARVGELLDLVQLSSYARMYPDQLSGGQRQRVALARALAVKPQVLLLDEPFSALDAKVRKDLRDWLRRIHNELHVTTVLVTHDQEEALEVADRIAILNRGALEQVGTPQSIYDHPKSAFVYNFLGNVNLFHGRLLEKFTPPASDLAADEPAEAGIGFTRPHELELARELPLDIRAVKAIVAHVHAVGPLVRIDLRVDGNAQLLTAEVSRDRYNVLKPRAGEHLFVYPNSIRVFHDRETIDEFYAQGAGI